MDAEQPSDAGTPARTIRFTAGETELVGRLFLPPRARPRAAVVIHGATGVPQGFYSGFANWLAAERGLACLTYDYRDFGLSARGPTRAAEATMADWGLIDQPAAQRALEAAVPGVPVWVVGHSLGGLMLPLQEDAARIERAALVASGPVFWRDHPWSYMPLIVAFWFLFGPAATALFGYLPGRALGLGADLPSGVYWQWRRWCTTRGFYGRDLGRTLPPLDPGRIRARVAFVAAEDDKGIPPEVSRRLHAYYPVAERTERVLAPRAFGLRSIGHLGMFARRNSMLWPAIIDAIDPQDDAA